MQLWKDSWEQDEMQLLKDANERYENDLTRFKRMLGDHLWDQMVRHIQPYANHETNYEKLGHVKESPNSTHTLVVTFGAPFDNSEISGLIRVYGAETQRLHIAQNSSTILASRASRSSFGASHASCSSSHRSMDDASSWTEGVYCCRRCYQYHRFDGFDRDLTATANSPV